MKLYIIAQSIAIAVLAVGSAQAQTKPNGLELAETVFASLDADGSESLSYSEMLEFSSDVFFSMDYDEDAGISYEEFSGWGFGIVSIAEDEGRTLEVLTAKKMIFGLWDRDNDNVISEQEQERAIIESANYADLNGDRLLSQAEYIQGFITNIAFRSALRNDR